jgi:TP53 regulating kinase-like protein
METKMKQIGHGAEAIIYLTKDKEGKDIVIKERIPKSYRLAEIDNELRKSRTNREAKVIQSMPVAAPKLYYVDNKTMKIEMEYIDGEKLSDVLEKKDYKRICNEIGRMVAEMHSKDMIHGDLTTSNMILASGTKDKSHNITQNKTNQKIEKQKKDSVYFIDFGLSFFSTKTEDKAVDLHLLRQALESRHYTIFEESFKEVLLGYDDKEVIKKLEDVEKRGRNKAKI